VGAQKGDILAQFLIEAAMLGAAGGVAGVLFGLVGVRWLASLDGQREVAQITWQHCVSVTVLAAVVSMLFAALPAWQAAQLDPVEALRAEA
jgi:putative ABC transport system permease protein